ncbi:uncharacterized protein P884DRAFT_296780 [Thermothelomyces heterothallicus CBS 202.75]|uniref:uncharacterized protein n=1 Tax=Thermothelomyces heterothallicus CBS 202.75 TaxID=1149848 RepID=UPI00374426FC
MSNVAISGAACSSNTMDAQDAQDSQYWTRLFVEAAQSERQKREDHTTDVAESIRQHTAAAEDKIAAALGPELDTPFPNTNGNPRAAARG